MSHQKTIGIVFLLTLVGLGKAIADGVPTVTPLTYSGVLQTTSGAPITGTQSMQLTFWDDAAANASANQKCKTSTQSVTADAQGRFQVTLDQACVEVVRTNPNLWVQLQVGAILLPRSKLGAVPYALEAGKATRVALATATGRATVEGLYCGPSTPVSGAWSSNGGLTGILAGKKLCEQTCASTTAHPCLPAEATRSYMLGTTPIKGWVAPAGFDPRNSGGYCGNYKSAVSTNLGTIFDPLDFGPWSDNCNNIQPILCCD